MYAALAWVPRGTLHAKLPEAPPAGAEAAAGKDEGMAPEHEENGEEANGRTVEEKAKPMKPESDSDSDAPARPDEVDLADVLAKDLDGLSFFRSNTQDPYLAGDASAARVFDDEELEDLTLRSTDAMIIGAKSGEDASVLEFNVFEDDDTDTTAQASYRPHFYVHHEVLLPTLPLCVAYSSMPVDGSSLHLVAVGCFTPGIDVWDVEQVNVLEPLMTLGGYDTAPVKSEERKPKRSAKGKHGSKVKKRPKVSLKDGSHSDAVMALSWNNVQREYLASGSADTTIKIWDAESAHCATTLQHHSGKVQAVEWHPKEQATLLSGSFDRTAQIIDVRNPEPVSACMSLSSDVETAHWCSLSAGDHIIVTTENGDVELYDRRTLSGIAKKSRPLARWRAHNGAASACALSAHVPGMVVTGGVDKTVKVWDVRGAGPEVQPSMVYERPSRAGAVFSASLCPLASHGGASEQFSPFTLAFAGAKGVLVVTDLAVESDKVLETFGSALSPRAADIVKSRASRRPNDPAGRRKPISVRDPQLEGDDSDNSDDSGSSEWESASSGDDIDME